MSGKEFAPCTVDPTQSCYHSCPYFQQNSEAFNLFLNRHSQENIGLKEYQNHVQAIKNNNPEAFLSNKSRAATILPTCAVIQQETKNN